MYNNNNNDDDDDGNNNNEYEEIIKVAAHMKLDELKIFFLLLSLLSKVSKDITFEFSEIDRNSALGKLSYPILSIYSSLISLFHNFNTNAINVISKLNSIK